MVGEQGEESMTDYKAQVHEARRAQTAVYLATHEDVAADLSRIIEGLADAVEALERRAVHAELEWSEASARAEALVAENADGKVNFEIKHRAYLRTVTERDEALQALAESRARYGELEARLVEAEATLAKLRDEALAITSTTRENGTEFERGQENVSDRVLEVTAEYHPVVLADHDKEVAARALEEFADEQFGSVDPERPPWASEVMIRDRAASIRSGSEGDTRG
jgi:chromosome segregation ATPase